jgi:hypothetical protein
MVPIDEDSNEDDIQEFEANGGWETVSKDNLIIVFTNVKKALSEAHKVRKFHKMRSVRIMKAHKDRTDFRIGFISGFHAGDDKVWKEFEPWIIDPKNYEVEKKLKGLRDRIKRIATLVDEEDRVPVRIKTLKDGGLYVVGQGVKIAVDNAEHGRLVIHELYPDSKEHLEELLEVWDLNLTRDELNERAVFLIGELICRHDSAAAETGRIANFDPSKELHPWVMEKYGHIIQPQETACS